MKTHAPFVVTVGCLLTFISAPSAFADSMVYSANAGNNTVYTYDEGTKAPTLFETSATGVSSPTAMIYDSADRTVFLADGPSNTIYQYDPGSGAVVSHFSPSSPSAPVSSVTAMTYDSAGNIVYVADATTRTVYQYDDFGVTAGQQFTTPPSTVTPTAVAYDSIDRALFVGYDNGTIYRYDSAGAGTQITNSSGLGAVTAMTYDSGDGRLLTAYDNGTSQTIYRYDDLGGAVTENLFNDSTDLGRVTAMTYDAFDRLVLVGYGNAIYDYDSSGTRSFFSSTDVNGVTALADVVPEPSTLALVVLGAAALVTRRRSR